MSTLEEVDVESASEDNPSENHEEALKIPNFNNDPHDNEPPLTF